MLMRLVAISLPNGERNHPEVTLTEENEKFENVSNSQRGLVLTGNYD